MTPPAEQRFDTWDGYRFALLDAIGRAERCVALFDTDLRETGLESAAGVEALKAVIVRTTREDALRFLLHDPKHLTHHCPRLLALLGTHSHRMQVRVADESFHAVEQMFAIVDDRHLVLRFHRDLPRGRYAADAAESAAPFRAQFETIWVGARNPPIGAPLGL